MSDGSRWNPADIEVGEEGSSKKNLESLKEQLKVVDNLKEKGEALLEKIYGDGSHDHTIFKCERKADGRGGPPEPKAVAIGPYHRNCKNRLTFGDDYKLEITRFMVQYCGLDAEEYLNKMEEKENDVRSCYDKDLSDWSNEEFQRMLLLDSSFILFMMDGFYKRNLVPANLFTEYMALHLEIREHSEQIKLDMLTVDNQIPFFTIERLLGCFPQGSSIRKESVEELALWCFDDLWPMKNEEQVLGEKRNEEQDLVNKRNEENDLEKKRKEEQVIRRGVAQFLFYRLRLFDLWSRIRVTGIGVPWFLEEQETSRDAPDRFHHLLHLFHWSRIPKEGYEIDFQTRGLGRWHYKNASKQYIPSATELRKSATKFKKKDLGSCLDVTFNRRLTFVTGVINIPVLQLYDYSEPIFRNLIAFEATPTNRVLCFTAYTQCMSRMLQQEDDVKLLRERRIIASTSYNNADVIRFFKDMNAEIEDIEMPYTLLVLYDDITNHYNSRISKWWGNFMLQYCPNFWVALSLVAAIVLFALSFLQALYGMLSYYAPKKNK
ncbi:putative UPF0481 protein At3g02645 [Ananas comosus]|uniref:UPF0481 protein At3g02645 n=2 Tax=Ananas comosus TaxID=4615 RepID=A0A6P5FA35_ANACO|nr:putative UPF0481 protein At3g02645 [Ananas comosus]CAD1827529.1 unnamed protein product [Ananas comosus var. bracteatus]